MTHSTTIQTNCDGGCFGAWKKEKYQCTWIASWDCAHEECRRTKMSLFLLLLLFLLSDESRRCGKYIGDLLRIGIERTQTQIIIGMLNTGDSSRNTYIHTQTHSNTHTLTEYRATYTCRVYDTHHTNNGHPNAHDHKNAEHHNASIICRFKNPKILNKQHTAGQSTKLWRTVCGRRIRNTLARLFYGVIYSLKAMMITMLR